MRRPAGLFLLGLLLAGCATTRVVPVPAAGVEVAEGTATVAAEGVQIVVRPSAWRGSPSYLPRYVTPFHLLIVDGSPLPVSYDYADLRLYDEARFQYTALPPAEVGRLLQWSRADGGVQVAATDASVTAPARPRRRPVIWQPWWDPWWGPWGPWGPWGGPYYPYYYAPPSITDVITQALPVGALQPGARTEGFVYFPLLRAGVSRVAFEFHYRLGEAPRVLIVPFGVERAERGHGEAAS